MSGMFQDQFPKAGEPRPISHIQCGLCPRSPTVGSCLACGIRGCAGCIEPLTRECWACLGYGSPQDVSDDSDIHGVPKVPGQSSEDLAKQTFLEVIGIMQNVRRKYQRDLVNGPWNYGVPENVYCLPNVYQVRKFRRHITVIA